ncbi:MAG: hypothetical protein QOJ81_1749 [Chloroflexota bacterium]|nr:hypothetical protein [Chloroflexota bacterium]
MTAAFTYREVESSVDPSKPLIYLWEIRDAGGRLMTCYAGESVRGAGRPRTAYARNVDRLRVGIPWHSDPTKSYRRIHHALSEAIDRRQVVTLTLLCNVHPGENINQIERRERARHGCPGQ